MPSPVKTAALKYGVPIHQPQALREFAKDVGSETFDLFVLASYGRILPGELLRAPRLGALNVHPSLLPRYRGATPIQNALRDGVTETGVTIMLMDEGMDTGDIVLQNAISIGPDETYGVLHDRLAIAGAQLLEAAIELLAEGRATPFPQNGAASVTKPLRKEDLLVDWMQPAPRIAAFVRSLAPAPLARANLCQTPVKLVRARASGESASGEPGVPVRPAAEGRGVLVPCGAGVLEIEELIPPNRGPLSGAQFYATYATR